ncbi:NETI motif-containing protein [Bacillus sp. V5-8f]|uniref:NETI motif-containing protein n=1 Tax=Bacillus sp. V5-8f TaxID=2053044 RepID=UPI0015E099C5
MFEVTDGESIDECLDRMKEAGYLPIKRIEKPIFEEKVKDGKVEYEPVQRKIVFEGKLIE